MRKFLKYFYGSLISRTHHVKRIKNNGNWRDTTREETLFFVFIAFPPFHCSKWCVSLEEYPYHLWPPYVSGFGKVLSRDALFQMYYASFFVKRIRLEDIYLGLIARKLRLEPLHSPEFYYFSRPFDLEGYR